MHKWQHAWRRLQAEEQGATMVMTAVAMTALLLFCGLALDFGRAHLLRASLQTAVDAGSLAGALQVVPLVDIERDRWEYYTEICYDPVTRQPYHCESTRRAPPATAHGPRYQLINQGGWRQATASQCSYPYYCGDSVRITREELYLPPSTSGVAVESFHKNTGFTRSGATLTGPPKVQVDQAKTEVTVTATVTTQTHFLRLIGMDQLTITRTGSAVPVRR